MRTEYWWINAEIKGYEGGEGKITGRVNVCGAWTGGASRTDPEGFPKKWRSGNDTRDGKIIS